MNGSSDFDAWQERMTSAAIALLDPFRNLVRGQLIYVQAGAGPPDDDPGLLEALQLRRFLWRWVLSLDAAIEAGDTSATPLSCMPKPTCNAADEIRRGCERLEEDK